ncbi:3'-5' exonuclease [Prosthecochloris sp. SCSIO W1101]|uniref:3'-5' exonuclease n=1 Tax=Prosthecochloris sp. SCSIO W1101 TaxID=2992242 RepID=UPI00223DB5E5|nr:3'-5' exonuclease [Prosthecochloris sp. SCSIO W1101]UZJ42488.1 3'-5' exonuclease [Prosthecochloris sp. SCSIO W1101]
MINFLAKRIALRRCRCGELPAIICGYVNSFAGSSSFDLPLEKVRFVVFDTETTGFDCAKDLVISIGAIALNGVQINVEDSFEVLIRRDSVGDCEAVTTHGLLLRDLHEGCDENEAINGFLEYARDSVLVAQHADFDVAMINRILKHRYRFELFNQVIDTASLAKRLEKGPYYNLAHKGGEYRLDVLLERYNIRLYDRHTAAGDAFLTAQLFQMLLMKARHAGIKTLRELFLK